MLRIDHDEAEQVEDSEDDLDLDFPNETTTAGDYRPAASSRRQRHSVDVRLKKPVTDDTETHKVNNSPRLLADKPKKKKKSPPPTVSAAASTSVTDQWNPCTTSPESDQWNPCASPELRDIDDLNPAAAPRGFPLSQPAIPAHSRPRSRDGLSMGDMPSELDLLTSERPRSRGQGEDLAPLRVSTPTAAQLMSSLRARHGETPPSPSRHGRKLR